MELDTNQTQVTTNIKDISNSLNYDGLDFVFKSLEWISKNIDRPKEVPDKNEIFRKRTADQIITSGFASGCTDMALVFIALCKAKGIKAAYVEAINKSWLESNEGSVIGGHVFAEVYLNNNTYIVDPDMGRVDINLETAYRHFEIYTKGTDSWDIGIRSFEDLKEKFTDFKENYSKKPIGGDGGN